MKKYEIKHLGEAVFYEKLKNGLEIYIHPKDKMADTIVEFVTKFGAIDTEFVPIGETKYKKFPDGIAHFLEHKLNDLPDGTDSSAFFIKNGAYSNAATSSEFTKYIFSGSNNFKQNLLFLLDFVQAPYFTKELVNKEKGIIEQEISMRNDNHSVALFEAMRKQLFHKLNFRVPVAGNVKSINSITEEDLKVCYENFYHPSNMFLAITGKVDPKKIIETIKQNQNLKSFSKPFKVKRKKQKEPIKVKKSYGEIKMAIEQPKFGFGIKVENNIDNADLRMKNTMYIEILFNLLFGATSVFYHKLREEKLLTLPFSIYVDEIDGFDIINISNSVDYPKKVLERIKEELRNIKINNQDFERQVKVYRSAIIYSYDHIGRINHHMINEIISYNKIITNDIEILNTLTKKELEGIVNLIDFKNNTSFIIYPKDNKK